MGKTRHRDRPRGGVGGAALSSFPSPSSSSSSDFEFTVSLSPSSRRSTAHLCPADELFYKGQLLPLHLSPRISMVRTLLLASSSTSSSSDATTTASRDSNGSTSSCSSYSSSAAADLLLVPPDCDSSRPSSVTEEDAKRVSSSSSPRRPKYFSSFATRFSSVFLHRGSKKDPSAGTDLDIRIPPPPPPRPSTKRPANLSSSSSAREVIKKYVKKVKPLYEKLSSLQQKQSQSQSQHPPHQQSQSNKKNFSFSIRRDRDAPASCFAGSVKKGEVRGGAPSTVVRLGIYTHSHSFSGNLRYPRSKRFAGSCPSSVRSSPSHSGLLSVGGFPDPPSAASSSMEELQSAIQGAIAHCKSTMVQSKDKIPSGSVSRDEIRRS